MITNLCELGRERCRWCWEESQQTFDPIIVPDVPVQQMPSLEALSWLPLPDRALEAIWHQS